MNVQAQSQDFSKRSFFFVNCSTWWSTEYCNIAGKYPCYTTTSDAVQAAATRENSKRSLSLAIKSSADSTAVNNQVNIQEINGAGTASKSSSGAAVTTSEVNPKLLKRRHVPTGTMYVTKALELAHCRLFFWPIDVVCLLKADDEEVLEVLSWWKSSRTYEEIYSYSFVFQLLHA